MSNITADRAGMTSADDRYGWSTGFVPMLARVTRRWPAREGLTFGLYGPWGSGKTTILNLLESHLADKSDEYPHTYVVRFNPWFYDNPKALIVSFFATMGETLKTLGAGKKWAEAGDLLKKVGKFLSVASKGISVVGVKLDAEAIQEAADTVSGAGELAEMADSGERPLQEARKKLTERLLELGEAGGRVMVLIDDVDRLDSVELFSLLRLLRTVADLPSITILVAMDEHRVREVLDRTGQYGYGRAYLEKIVQAHVHVPVAPEQIVEEELRCGIVDVLTQVGADIPEELAAPRQHSVYLRELRILNRIIRTPRDLGRYLNGLRLLTLTRTRWDLDSEDATHLAALQVFYPDVYDRVRHSESFLTTSIQEHLLGRTGNEEADRQRRQKELNWIITGNENSEAGPEHRNVSKLLSRMFGDLVTGESKNVGFGTAERKIRSPSVFGAYFEFHIELAWLTRNEVAEAVQSLVGALSVAGPEALKIRLIELTEDPRWNNEAVLPDDLRTVFSRLPSEQLIDLAYASIYASEGVEKEPWEILWQSMMNALRGRMASNATLIALQALAGPVRQWIDATADPKEALERLEQAESNFAQSPTAATDSFGDAWLTNWERYLGSPNDPFQDYTPGWGVKLFITALRWEHRLSRDIGSSRSLHEFILQRPERLPIIFSKVKEMASSRPREILEHLVGGFQALGELVAAASKLDTVDQTGELAELREAFNGGDENPDQHAE